jgi:anti-sigma B factor antagonist
VQWNETQRELSTVIELTGEIDLQHSPALRQTLKDKAASQCPALILDFTKVEYVDSSGLATLVEYVRDAQAFDGKFALVGVGQRVRSIIELVRLDELLKMHPSVIEAESSFLPS